jgi:ABC-2 type transport system ATP-binding protein
MYSDAKQEDVLLHAERIRVEFGRLLAVHDLSFELRRGHLLGLIGPNGAGKTTLLRALAGLQPLSAGRVKVMGETVRPGEIAALQHIGFTPDNPPLYEELTVRQFLQFIAYGYGLSPQEARGRIALWVEHVWLTEKLEQRIKTLSRGMRQRIGLARTLISNPSVILLDEPAAGLDPAGRVQFRRLLTTLREQGKALIVSSHILADMNEYCTHIAIMAHGTFLQHGTVAQVSGHGDGERCRYTVILTRPIPDIREILAGMPDLVLLAVDRDQIVLEYGQDRERAAELLAWLIRADLPVAVFQPHGHGLEEAYLRAGIRQVD